MAKSKAKAFFVDRFCHPQTIAVIKTRALPLGIEIIEDDVRKLDPTKVFGAIFQYPSSYGHVTDFTQRIASLHGGRLHSLPSPQGGTRLCLALPLGPVA